MGYSGEVYYNEEGVYQEWKHDNVTFCLSYAQTYLRQKPCLLTREAIDAAYSDIYNGVSSCSRVLLSVDEAMDIIKALVAASKIFDDNGNLTGAIKIQGADEYCNSATINFYKEGKISNAPEVELDNRYCVKRRQHTSKDELNDIKRKRVSGIDITGVSLVFRAMESYQSFYKTVEDLINIRSRNDIYSLIDTMQEVLKNINEIYIKKCAEALALQSVLKQASEAMASGTPVYVSYVDGFLYTSIGENTIKTELEDFFIVSELFQNNGITPCSAYVGINDKDTLMDFINSFPKNEKRSSEFEEIFKNISLVVGDSKFSIFISGGY